MSKQLFSVTVTETVIARYLPVIVESADCETAKAIVEAQRCDGELGDPQQEDVQSVSYEVDPALDTDLVPCAVDFCVTEAGDIAIAAGNESVVYK
jgi:hypothetical protein